MYTNISYPSKTRFRKKVRGQASDHVWSFLNSFSKRPPEKQIVHDSWKTHWCSRYFDQRCRYRPERWGARRRKGQVHRGGLDVIVLCHDESPSSEQKEWSPCRCATVRQSCSRRVVAARVFGIRWRRFVPRGFAHLLPLQDLLQGHASSAILFRISVSST